MLGASVSVMGTAMAQQHLRNILASLDCPTLAQPEAFLNATGGLFGEAGGIGDGARPFLQEWIERYAAWVRLHATELDLDALNQRGKLR